MNVCVSWLTKEYVVYSKHRHTKNEDVNVGQGNKIMSYFILIQKFELFGFSFSGKCMLNFL